MICPSCKQGELKPIKECYQSRLRQLNYPGMLPFLALLMPQKYDSQLYWLQPPIKPRVMDVLGIWSILSLALLLICKGFGVCQITLLLQWVFLLVMLPLAFDLGYQWRIMIWCSKWVCLRCKKSVRHKIV